MQMYLYSVPLLLDVSLYFCFVAFRVGVPLCFLLSLGLSVLMCASSLSLSFLTGCERSVALEVACNGK